MTRSKEHQRAVGVASEHTARLAIEVLVTHGTLAGYREDAAANHHGVDFTLVRLDGARVPLQVKSSEHCAARHRQRHPHVPVIVVGRRQVGTVQRDILRVLKKEYP